MTAGDPRQRVDSSEITVDILGLALHSGVKLGLEGVPEREVLAPTSPIL